MSQISINSENSVYLNDDGILAIATGAEASRQDIMERIATWQGEDYLNRLFGLKYSSLLNEDINVNYFITDFQRNVLECFNVVNFNSFSWEILSGTRELRILFSVQVGSSVSEFKFKFPIS